MGIKTTVNEKGIISERVEGADSFHVNIRQQQNQQHFTAGTGGTISGSLAVFQGSVAGVTGVLPTIGAHNLGLEVTVINADLTQDIQISASQPIDLGTYVHTVPEESARFLAISSSTGFSWIVTAQHA